jgi:hypothetical protein
MVFEKLNWLSNPYFKASKPKALHETLIYIGLKDLYIRPAKSSQIRGGTSAPPWHSYKVMCNGRKLLQVILLTRLICFALSGFEASSHGSTN